MKRAFLFFALVACGGSTQHTKVDEVPIDQGGGGGGSGLPPDEMGDAGIVTSNAAVPDGSAPPGVGPQSLDVQPDAGGSTSTPTGFVQRQGGLTQKECTDVVLVFAKATAKEGKQTAPTAADLAGHAIYGPMINECGQNTTKKQQKCAMAVKSSAAWKKCME